MRLAYGDALTTNTAQGTTVSEHIHAIPKGSRLATAFAAYTSGSRHRDQTFIVMSDGAERSEITGRRPLGDSREILKDDILANVTRNFAQQPQKESALDMIDRATQLRRGTIQMTQRLLQFDEAKGIQEKTETSLSERLADHALNRAIESRLQRLAERIRRHGEVLVEAARMAAALTKRLATFAALPKSRRHSAPKDLKTADEITETATIQRRTKRRGVSL